MIDRRILLASVASFLGLAAFRWLRGSPAIAAEKFEVEKTDAEWRAQLTPQQYEILRKEGTERPGSSPLLKEHRKGIFACAGCDLPLFSSETKFESGTGWPSFYQPLENAVGKTEDRTFGMLRTEIHCRRCGGHLGHVFDDGPKPTGLRDCMDGFARQLLPAGQLCPGPWTGAFSFKYLKHLHFHIWHADCDVSLDDGHGLAMPAGCPDRMWRQRYGYLRRAHYSR